MPDLTANILQGVIAFVATNLDDVVVLILFYTQLDAAESYGHVVIGQYLGFSFLLLLSLPGYFGGTLLPRPWIGLLGLLPLAIGLQLLLTKNQDNDESIQTVNNPLLQRLSGWCPPRILQVAAVTVANGGDNIGIYVPLFASKKLIGLLAIMGTFLVMVGIWCWLAWSLVKQPSIGQLVSKYGDRLIPWVFIALGVCILYESGTISDGLLKSSM